MAGTVNCELSSFTALILVLCHNVYTSIAYLFWQPHVMNGAGAGGELREYERGGLGAGHGLVGVDERELLPKLSGCK